MPSPFGGIQRYKVFLLRHRKPNIITAKNISPFLYSGVPSGFHWHPQSDMQGLHTYIDALISGQASTAAAYERDGFVTNIELPPDVPPEQKIRVGIDGFVDYLLLRGHVDVPIGKTIFFVTDRSSKLVPRNYIAALGPLLKATGREGALDPDSGWEFRMSNDEAMSKATLGMYADKHQAQAAPAAASMDAQPESVDTQQTYDEAPQPAEIEVRRRLHDRHAVIITQVEPVGARVFYARRVIDYRGNLLWVGSSWSAQGPWRVTHRDASRMLALGVREP